MPSANELSHVSCTGRGVVIKDQSATGHASDVMLARYIREGEIFEGNAAGALL